MGQISGAVDNGDTGMMYGIEAVPAIDADSLFTRLGDFYARLALRQLVSYCHTLNLTDFEEGAKNYFGVAVESNGD